MFEVLPGEPHYNPIGVVHGGVAMTLLDSAMGCAVQTQLPAGAAYTTLEVKVNFLRALTADSGPGCAARARSSIGASTVATAEGRI